MQSPQQALGALHRLAFSFFAGIVQWFSESPRSSIGRASGFYPLGWGFDSLRGHYILSFIYKTTLEGG